MSRKKTSNKKNNIILIISIVFILLIILIGRTTAKYVMEKMTTRNIESSKFYFEWENDDMGTGKNYTISLDPEKAKQINFSVKNYIDNLQYTKENIKYKIDATSASDKISTKILDSSNNEITSDSILTLSGNSISKNNYTLIITPNKTLNAGDEIDIILKITSTTPYVKEMSSNIKIKVVKSEEYTTNFISKDNYVILEINTNHIENDIKIQYDNSKLILDKSYALVNKIEETSINSVNNFTIPSSEIKDKSNYKIIFIKKDKSSTITFGNDLKILD